MKCDPLITRLGLEGALWNKGKGAHVWHLLFDNLPTTIHHMIPRFPSFPVDPFAHGQRIFIDMYTCDSTVSRFLAHILCFHFGVVTDDHDRFYLVASYS